MKKISEIDRNFAVPASAGDGLTFLPAHEPPFSLRGLMREDGWYCRMPRAVAEKVNEGTAQLYRHTSGGRVRFCTDSPMIAIRAEMPFSLPMPHMPLTGSGGFDLYRDGQFLYTFIPPMSAEEPYVSEWPMPGEGMHEYEINFPLYHDVEKLYIGLKSGAKVAPGRPYRTEQPVVFYGSSITQGGCASRPGMCYTHILARMLDFDFINLGFSGNARGEETMADYIASLPMSVFVMDYDHNAPTLEHLQKTHHAFAARFRKARPDVPIVFVSRPDSQMLRPYNIPERKEVIEATWRALREAGDGRVWFVDGDTLWAGPEWGGCTVDGCHPNDLGFYRMAMGIAPALREALACIRNGAE